MVRKMIEQEWREIIQDKRLLAILLLVPIFYTLLFGYLYINSKVTELSTIVYLGEDSTLTREIVLGFDQSDIFSVSKMASNEEEVISSIQKGDYKVGIIIPPHLTEDIKRGSSTEVLTMVDGSNMLVSNAATKGANEVVQTFSTGAAIEKLAAAGMDQDIAMKMVSPIQFRYRVLYNPTFNYSNFLLIGLLGAILQQVLFLGLALGVAREKERGTWNPLLMDVSSPWKVAYGKSVPYFLIGLSNFILVFLLAKGLFQIPFKGSLWLFILLGISFQVALAGIGFLASLTSANQLQATQITMLIAVPSFLLSGFTWPFGAMPSILVKLGHLLPLTYFLDGIRELTVKGNGVESLLTDVLVLFGMGLISFAVSILIMYLSRTRKKDTHDSLRLGNTERATVS
ncbi:ABC transporter permease [Microaerobacter geothermalis]|uniref:ABC transporter permease n=1 Tax=Microaerobacter geothermalis TaxID=674972 RepID=UPI001F2D0F27|nr:ABC transporter permease [Microaerobacter geothermalis]MCF6095052.1 ABC transporter permease [Microaerobacter geothermalis]